MGPWARGPGRAGPRFFDFLWNPGRAIFGSASKFAARGANRHVIWSREGPNQAIFGNPYFGQPVARQASPIVNQAWTDLNYVGLRPPAGRCPGRLKAPRASTLIKSAFGLLSRLRRDSQSPVGFQFRAFPRPVNLGDPGAAIFLPNPKIFRSIFGHLGPNQTHHQLRLAIPCRGIPSKAHLEPWEAQSGRGPCFRPFGSWLLPSHPEIL